MAGKKFCVMSRAWLLTILITTGIAGISGAGETPNVSSSIAIEDTYGVLPLHFEANHGQMDANVSFRARGEGYHLFLTPTEAVLALRNGQPKLSTPTVVRMQLVGGNASPSVVGKEVLPGIINRFTGHDPEKWKTNIPTYSKVHYHDVYPEIDLTYYGNQGQLEFDFIVAPGADPTVIRLAFEGLDDTHGKTPLRIDGQGNLLLRSAEGELRLHTPQIYQEIDAMRVPVRGQFKLLTSAPDTLASPPAVGFEVAAYDTSRSLIIDPVLEYSTFLGGNDDDDARSIVVNAAGSAYITGITDSLDFPTANPFQGEQSPGATSSGDVFVTKLNPTGSALVYSTFLGGNAVDLAIGIGVDGTGNAYITGSTSSDNFPTVNPIQGTKAGRRDAFVAKLDPTGSQLLYSTYLGGSDDQSAEDIAVDAAGNAYLTGWTGSEDFPTANPDDPMCSCSADFVSNAFVAKLDPTGSTLLFSTFLGTGFGVTTGRGISVDTDGNAYVTGEDRSSLNANAAVFVTKLDPTGSTRMYSITLNGRFDEFGEDIAVDTAGNAYITGSTSSDNFPTVNPLQDTKAENSDAFVVKLDPTGTTIYSTFLGGGGRDTGRAIVIDSVGNMHITGEAGKAFSNSFPTVSPIQDGDAGSFVAKLDPAGSELLFSTILGDGTGNDIAVDAADNAYVTGRLDSGSGFSPVTPLQPTFGGGFDAFVAKIVEGTSSPGSSGGQPDITWDVSGVDLDLVVCKNKTNGQKVRIDANVPVAGSCGDLGLAWDPGDNIQVKVVGTVESVADVGGSVTGIAANLLVCKNRSSDPQKKVRVEDPPSSWDWDDAGLPLALGDRVQWVAKGPAT